MGSYLCEVIVEVGKHDFIFEAQVEFFLHVLALALLALCPLQVA